MTSLQLAFDAVEDDTWEVNVVDQAILAVADLGVAFSANSVRDRLPVLKSNNLIGARFAALAKTGRIHRLKGHYEPSTAASTHGHPVAMWVKA